MVSIQSGHLKNIELESFVNHSSDGHFQRNESISIWEELFPETKTIRMSDVEDCINKIGEVIILMETDLTFSLKTVEKSILNLGNGLGHKKAG